MNYSQDELEADSETVVKAHEIQNDKEKMKALEPYLKEKMARIDKVLSLKDLWKLGREQAAADEAEEKATKEAYFGEKSSKNDENSKHIGEKPLVKDDLALGSKA